MSDNNTKILVICSNEDTHLIQKSLKTADGQFDIINEHSLESASKCLVNNTFDSIILDVNLLDKDGLEALKNITRKFPDLPVITLLTDTKNKDIAIATLQIKEQTLRLHGELMKNMSEGVYLISTRDRKIVYTNPKFENMFGYEPGEMLGKDVMIVNAPTEKNPEEVAKEIIEILNRTGEWNGEIENIKKDETHFWCRATCSMFDHAEYGKVIIAIHTDITERKNADEKLKKAYKNLERSNNELEQFAYVASHDLQEPLRTIYGFVELLAANYKGKLDSDAEEYIEFITTGTRRMQQMIDDLLTLSRITTKGKKFAPVNIERILKVVLENLRSLIDKNHAVIIYDSIPTIIADDSQIIQLFQNLIENAIKFHREETPEIHISSKRQNGYRVFSIKDNGIGIDKNQFKKLFVVFQRLHSRDEYPGTGIGLAICKKIVERHEGRIWIESEVGIGSTFYFTIPVRPTGNDRINQVQI